MSILKKLYYNERVRIIKNLRYLKAIKVKKNWTYLANLVSDFVFSGPYLKAAPAVSANPIDGFFDRVHNSWLHFTCNTKFKNEKKKTMT